MCMNHFTVYKALIIYFLFGLHNDPLSRVGESGIIISVLQRRTGTGKGSVSKSFRTQIQIFCLLVQFYFHPILFCLLFLINNW